MDIKVAFKNIVDKVDKALAPQGFAKEKISSGEKDLVALFTSQTVAYSVLYDAEKSYMIFRSCSMTEEGPDNEWKILATWMFNPEEDGQREADSIANDFVDNCSNEVNIKRIKNTKKKRKKSSDDGNADPIFLAKRFVAFFPELKEEIIEEEENYYSFRGVTFTREKIVPRVNELIMGGNKTQIDKLCQLLSTQYGNGDVDTRSIITIVILNSVPMEKYELIYENLSEDLQKIWKEAVKLRGKKIKPEKQKKKKPTMAERLGVQQ